MSELTTAQGAGRTGFDIGTAFRFGWRRFVDDIGPLLLATIIATALTVVSLGILGGPLLAGLYSMVIGRLRDGRRAEIGDVFSCFDRFWSFFGAAVALVLLIGLAFITIIGGILLATIWMYVFPLMVDRGMGLGEAMGASKDLVLRAGLWEHLALVLLVGIIQAVANGPLVLLTTPFTVCLVGVAYYLAQGRADLAGRS